MRMPPAPYLQHRQQIGMHQQTRFAQESAPQTHQRLLQQLATRPGYHSDNRTRQALASSLLQCLAWLSMVTLSEERPSRSSTFRDRPSARQSMTALAQYAIPATATPSPSPDKAIRPTLYLGALARPRHHRHLLPLSPPTSVPYQKDDVSIQKRYNTSCINDGESLTVAQIFRQVGQTLRRPITMMTRESMTIDAWNKGHGCPTAEVRAPADTLASPVEKVLSLIITQLPGGQLFSAMQNLVGPLLERVADELEGKPVSQADEHQILQEIVQQAHMLFHGLNFQSQQYLKKNRSLNKPQTLLTLPDTHLQQRKTHIYLRMKDRTLSVPLDFRTGKTRARLPRARRPGSRHWQVYFDYVSRQWKTTGNGRFCRFSRNEASWVFQYSLGERYLTLSRDTGLPIYRIEHPLYPERVTLDAIKIRGQLLPFYAHQAKDYGVVYSVLQPEKPLLEVTAVNNEWHILPPKSRNFQTEYRFSPEYGRLLSVGKITRAHKAPIYYQCHHDLGFLWGDKMILDEQGYLRTAEIKKGRRRASARQNKKRTECLRRKRGAVLGTFSGCILRGADHDTPSEEGIPFSDFPVIARGSISTVYEGAESTVIKKYHGTIDATRHSRLTAANNNVRAFKRLYPDRPAVVSITPYADGSAHVSATLPLITGIPLCEINKINDIPILNRLSDMIREQNPSQILAERLQEKGIIHHDINRGNILFNKEDTFYVVDFDSATFMSEGQPVSPEQTAVMHKQFDHVFRDSLREVEQQRARCLSAGE